eukprot:gene7221-gene7946
MDASSHDILLRDLTLSKMKAKSLEVFGFELNSRIFRPLSEVPSFPIHGIILSDTYERIIIPVLVTYKRVTIQTTCLMDTGSPWTFMTKETLTALGIDVVSKDSYFDINVHGTPLTVYPSVNHFEDTNVCGQSFFTKHMLIVEIDY